ncbi:hypothetical protein G6F22_013873 [Rhizopus arrhizus]|nr:hypothetical protein G6F22_013873 [Rhizopus arrhizus]
MSKPLEPPAGSNGGSLSIQLVIRLDAVAQARVAGRRRHALVVAAHVLQAQRAAPVTHRPVQRGGAAGARQCAVAVVAGTVIRGLAGHQGLLEAEQVAPAAGHGEAAPAVGAEGAGGVQVQPRGGQLALVGVLVGDELDASLCITLHAAGEQGRVVDDELRAVRLDQVVLLDAVPVQADAGVAIRRPHRTHVEVARALGLQVRVAGADVGDATAATGL